eukprot:TRINITY_DN8516_c0_g1_i1.p1 TRINITY_DN8516_c0_g1~~TRINITY_DN8516_c0_g1_i1.p1  ORF type:complete len:351 (+),score=71.54 TRINITY_DN8516_c0_g1_i1:194-1246(+)
MALRDDPAKERAAVNELRSKLAEVTDEALLKTFQVVHQGEPDAALLRFLKAREYNVPKAFKMLMDCLEWRVKNRIDDILTKPLAEEKWKAIRGSQLLGCSGFDRSGKPVFAIRVGLSPYDALPLDQYVHAHIQMNEYRDQVLLPEASRRAGASIQTGVKVLDMTGLKLSALRHVKTLTAISSIDDLNYPEKSDTYYIVNAPFIFSACWKTVKPLLQERTKLKVRVLSGNGREELLQTMDESALPEFCRGPSKNEEGSSSGFNTSRLPAAMANDPSCSCSPLHPFHKKMREYMLQQQAARGESISRTGSANYANELVESADMLVLGQAVEKVLISGAANNKNGSLLGQPSM